MELSYKATAGICRWRGSSLSKGRRGLRGPAWVVAALSVWSAGCDSHERVAGPEAPEPEAPTFLAIVSNPVPIPAAPGLGNASGTEAEVAYVSLPPSTIPAGEMATIENRRTGDTVATPVVGGGFDPVFVVAQVGDTLLVEVRVAGSPTPIGVMSVVRPRKRPIVVRTDPPPGKRDVPLNASVVVVFSEPIDPATVSTISVQLLRDATPVSGTAGLVPGSPWKAEFTLASPLEPQTTYELAVTQDIQDVDGERLEAPVRVGFTTASQVSTVPVFTIAAGERHTCALDPSGAAYCWGMGGRLGNGSLFGGSTPVAVSGGLRFTSLAGGDAHTCGLASGAAYCWGDDSYGHTQSLTPVAVSGGLSFTLLAASASRTCGLTGSGVVYCWDGGWANSTPVAVSGGLIFTALAVGQSHTCGLASGAAYCWGDDSYGQLGTGWTGSSSSPVAVTGGAFFTALAAGHNHTCGLTSHGVAYCWGYNGWGQLGSYDESDYSYYGESDYSEFSPIPITVRGGHRFITLALGFDRTCGLTGAGAAYCWGASIDGQFGWPWNTSTPVAVSGGLLFTTLASGGSHRCGLTSAGAAYCWGFNHNGQLGSGSVTDSRTAVAVSGGLSFSSVATGSHYTCGLAGSGAAYCWGDNTVGQLGDGSFLNSSTPVAVSGGLLFTALVTAHGVTAHTCGLTSAGAAYCWGYNNKGQLGNGSRTNGGSGPVAVSGDFSFTALAAGSAHTCGLTSSGTAYCWGDDRYGQLGGETVWLPPYYEPPFSPTPLAVHGGHRFTALAAGSTHTCGLTGSGAVYCWGNNYSGQLGNDSFTDSRTPVAVSGGLLFTALASGGGHTCGLTSAGAAYCWGDDSPTPVPVSGGLSFTSVATGSGYTCGLTGSGAAYCWGNNYHGQLGDGSFTNRSAPVAVSGGLLFTALASGGSHTCGRTGAGAVYCWGDDYKGQLGRGTLHLSAVPIAVASFPAGASASAVPGLGRP